MPVRLVKIYFIVPVLRYEMYNLLPGGSYCSLPSEQAMPPINLNECREYLKFGHVFDWLKWVTWIGGGE